MTAGHAPDDCQASGAWILGSCSGHLIRSREMRLEVVHVSKGDNPLVLQHADDDARMKSHFFLENCRLECPIGSNLRHVW